MDKKIESQTKHIDFLNEEFELKEKEIVELKESLDNAIKLCTKKTAFAEEMSTEKCSLALDLKRMEEEMHDLKKLTKSSSQNSCGKYNRSMDEVVGYAEKNKSALIRLKTLAEDQKKRYPTFGKIDKT